MSQKYKAAEVNLQAVQSAFNDLSGAIGNPLWIQEWRRLEAKAVKKRGEAMMIYNVSPIQGLLSFIHPALEHIGDGLFNSDLTGWKKRGTALQSPSRGGECADSVGVDGDVN